MIDQLIATASLGRWLGPWAGERTPSGIARHEVHTPRTATRPSMRAYLFTPPTRARGTYLVLPGLHFLGPDDPRLDRFCRIVAAAGLVVVAPFIRSFTNLLIDATAFDDAEAALALARAESDARGLGDPAVFSISFGSRLALHLATRPAPPRAIVLFGGYAEFVPTVRFALTGRTHFDGEELALERDPLNSPVVFLHLLEQLAEEADRERLASAWRSMVHRTWGKLELKRPGARDPIAHEIASSLPSPLREPFLRGCGLAPDFIPWAEAAFDRAHANLAFLDPREQIARVACPTVLVHGREDDVIPYVESVKLSRALPQHHLRGLFVTGLYGHTGAAGFSPAAIAREASSMVLMLSNLAGAPFMGERPR
ncbi:MAG: hypothetical protein U0271_38020 [Polyangiaceae bacterium]